MAVGSAAAEMYRTVAGGQMEADDQAALEGILAEGDAGAWANTICGPAHLSHAVLDARALAGLFLFHEDVIWSARTYASAIESFHRLRSLIEGSEPLQAEVTRFHLSRGDERIETRAGRRLSFVVRPSGVRGLGADCVIAEECDLDTLDLHVPNVVTRAHPQLVLAW